jgi:hypothetical protein
VKRIGRADDKGQRARDTACCGLGDASCGCNVQPYIQVKLMSVERMGDCSAGSDRECNSRTERGYVRVYSVS